MITRLSKRQFVRMGLPLLIAAFALTLPQGASAESKVKKSTTTITTVESEGDEVVETQETKKTEESVLNAKFGASGQTGTTGCKTEELSKGVIKDLKSDCNAWIKDQKADLKDKYLAGSCEESCDDCGMGLRRCRVNGTVRYR